MKTLAVGVTGLCAGAAWYMSDSPDFDRVVKKAPMEVFAAFSRLAQEGVVTPPGQTGPGPRVSFKVEKVTGQSIHYEIQFDQRPVVEADLTFAPEGERETRMTAELDIDAFELGSAFQTEAGVALSLVPNRFIDAQFANFMEHMVRDVEAGRPLPPLATSSLNGLGVRASNSRVETNPERMRERAEEKQRAASRPMNSGRPMVDPNRAADQYLNTGSQNRGFSR